MKKVFFFGTPEIANPSLEVLAADENIEVVGVGVFPDRKVGRKQILTPCVVKVKAETLGLAVFEIKDKAALVELFKTQKFDLGIVIAFGMIFPEEVLEIPELGVVNVHFSLLPAYRGASPVQSAILNSDEISGITWQRMVKALDAGDILWQKNYNIQNQNTLQIWNNFAQYTSDEFPKFLENYFDRKIEPKAQVEEDATFCGKFIKQDGEVFLEKETAHAIYQKFLAFTPWPGIFVETAKGNLKIINCALESTTGSVSIECNNNSKLYISKAQLPGKKPVAFSEIIKGHPDILKS